MRETTAIPATTGANGFDFSEIEAFIVEGDDRLLNDKETARVYGVSRSKLWAGVKSGEFSQFSALAFLSVLASGPRCAVARRHAYDHEKAEDETWRH